MSKSNAIFAGLVFGPRSDETIAEPPMMDYDFLVRRRVPSDIRMKKMLPDDYRSILAFLDVTAELQVANICKYWTEHMLKDAEEKRMLKHVDFLRYCHRRSGKISRRPGPEIQPLAAAVRRNEVRW